ncbi:MAG: hypothetical protein GX916_10095 [Clostridiales bacterium]|nr:hypothetical protein [Clostridiales bacterium]
MIDLKAYVYESLTNALGGTPVHYFYPPINGELPCVSWYEAENRQHSQADTTEYLTEVAYVIDIWSKSAMRNGEIAQTIDQAMSAAGFRRAFAYDLYEPETTIHHKTMRYRALSDPEGVLYQ